MLAAYGSDAYKLVVVLHILCVVVGFGGVLLNGIYGRQAAARRGSEGLAISEANELVSKIAEYFIIAVFPLGLLLVFIGDNVLDFGETWLWLSMVVYLAALAVSFGLLQPRVRRLIALQRELVSGGPPPAGAAGPPPQVVELEALGKQVGMLSMVLHLAFVVVLVLMVFKPGSVLT